MDNAVMSDRVKGFLLLLLIEMVIVLLFMALMIWLDNKEGAGPFYSWAATYAPNAA
jgi:hypothetical protein